MCHPPQTPRLSGSNHADYFALVGDPTTVVPDGAVTYVSSYKLHNFDRDWLPF
jgi:hypothetical protein